MNERYPYYGNNSQSGYPSSGSSQQGYPQQGYQQPSYSQQGYPQAGYATAPQQVPQQIPQQQPQQSSQVSQQAPQQPLQSPPFQPPRQPQQSQPQQGPPRKKKRRGLRVLLIVALAALVAALACIGYIFYTYWNGQNEYDELTEYMQVDDRDGVLTLGSFSVDWDALRAKNPDIVGWVYLPDTVINYPIVWKQDDDVYYTTHTFGDNSVGAFGAEYGAIALSGANSPDWTDQANFISGHHMRNKSMFAILYDFQNDDTFNANRVFYVLTPEGNFKMTSFACDKVLGTSEDIVIPNFPTEEEFKDYLEARFNESRVNPDPAYVTVDDIEQIFAFYTCSEPDNQYRIMVYCSVDEFLPAGSDAALGSAVVDAEDIASVDAATGERLL